MRKERDYERLRSVIKGFGNRSRVSDFPQRFRDLANETMRVKTMCYDLEDKLNKLIQALAEKE